MLYTYNDQSHKKVHENDEKTLKEKDQLMEKLFNEVRRAKIEKKLKEQEPRPKIPAFYL
jgi:hypothetical protein